VRRLLPLVSVLYPFALVAALRWLDPLWIALANGVAVAAQLGSGRNRLKAGALVAFGLVALALLGLLDEERTLLFLPAATNVALLVLFGSTLWVDVSFVERIARARVPDLPAEEARYCRGVTMVWCAFFVANGAFCAGLAVYADRWLWASYTGVVAYVLMGLLFATEYLIRSKRFGRYRGSPVEPLLRVAFGPPRA
jgi:uncharacterized membrane protein